MRDRWVGRGAVSLAIVVGAVVSVYLIDVHHGAAAGEHASGICSLGARLNCAGAAASRWSEVGGVPTAVIGLGWYAAAMVLVLLSSAGNALAAAGARLALLGGAVVAVVYSVLLGTVSVVEIGSLCPACVVLYAVNFVVLWAAYRQHGGWPRASDLVGARLGPPLTASVATIVVVIAAWMVLGPAPAVPPAAEALDPSAAEALRAEHAPSKGPVDAPVTIVEFSDFECPYCARLAATLNRVADEFDGRVRLEFRHFPLDFHANAEPAARLAVCAAEQGRFWELHDAMFAEQSQLSRGALLARAGGLGLDRDALEACADGPASAAVVAADKAAGSAAGVTGTPSFFVNGRLHVGALPYEDVRSIVESALRARSGAAEPERAR